MKQIELTKSAVVFSSADHTYHLDGREISGVTPIVKWMFPDTYKDIPEDVLKRAADRGTSVHQDCQMVDAGFAPTSQEASEYLAIKEGNGLVTLKNEWLVDDGKDIASSIDVVFEDYSIADIKTTSKIHKANVTLQLSIYAWLLEKMNPGLEVPAIYVIWLPLERYGKPRLMELDRIASDFVATIVRAYLDGEDSQPYREALEACGHTADDDEELALLEQEYCELEADAKAIKARQEEIKEVFMKKLEARDDKTFKLERMTVSYVGEKTSTKVDTKKLKEQYGDVYAECTTTTTSKPTIQIRIKK